MARGDSAGTDSVSVEARATGNGGGGGCTGVDSGSGDCDGRAFGKWDRCAGDDVVAVTGGILNVRVAAESAERGALDCSVAGAGAGFGKSLDADGCGAGVSLGAK